MKIKCAMSHILSRSGVIAPVAAAEVTVKKKTVVVVQAVLTLVLRPCSCRGHVGRKLS